MVDWISFQAAIGVKAFKPVLELKDDLFELLKELDVLILLNSASTHADRILYLQDSFRPISMGLLACPRQIWRI